MENRLHLKNRIIIGNLTLTTHSKFCSCFKLQELFFYEQVAIMKNELSTWDNTYCKGKNSQ